MQILVWVTAIVLIAGIGMAGVMKLTKNQMSVEMAEKLDYSNLMMPIGAAEVAGAIGVLIGALSSDLEWIGVLAAIGVIALMIGAQVYHRRAGDTKEGMPSLVLLAVAVVYIVALFAN